MLLELCQEKGQGWRKAYNLLQSLQLLSIFSTMTHPDPDKQRQQEEQLRKAPAAQREELAYLFRIGNASYRYHQQTERLQPDKQDWEDWLVGLPTPMQRNMRARGFEACRSALPFQRFVEELRGEGMDAWMREHLSPEDYRRWKGEEQTS